MALCSPPTLSLLADDKPFLSNAVHMTFCNLSSPLPTKTVHSLTQAMYMCYTISPYEFPQSCAFYGGIATGTKASFFVFIYMRGDAPLVSTSINIYNILR